MRQPDSASDKFFVPKFDNTTVGYKEWRKRVQLYAHRQKLQGREKETALNVLALLDGASWRQCEDLEISELAKEEGILAILKRLDAQWQYDEKVEMPEAFEKFFFKMVRKQGQSLLEYCTEFNQSLRELMKFKIALPPEVTGWLMLRRAALTREQQTMVQTHIGTTLTLTAVEPALYLLFGQDHRHAHVAQRRIPLQQGRWKNLRLVHAVTEEAEAEGDWEYDQAYYDEDGTEAWPDEDESPYDTYWQEEEDPVFYEAAEADESLFDTEEFDQIYAAYTDAKQRMQQLRQSRGFYPVVAMVDQRQMPYSPSSQSPSSPPHGGGKKGKNRKGKGKSGKSSSSASTSGKGPTGKARARDALPAMETRTCLRCGKVGHLAANCSSKSTSPAKKRVLEDGDPLLAGMVMTSEVQYHDTEEDEFHDVEEAYAQGDQLVRAGGWLTERPDVAIQDQGASSFLLGTEYLLRYVRWLHSKGFDLSSLEFKRCDKMFRFGGDAEGCARWMVNLPVLIEGVAGRIQAYVIFGATPMLLGRPILEKLQAIVDFGGNRMKIMGGPWKDIDRGKQGSMLLQLCQQMHDPWQLSNPSFDLRSEDDHDKNETFQDFLEDMGAHDRYEEMASEIDCLVEETEHERKEEGIEKTVQSLEKLFVACELQLQDLKKKQRQMLNEARPSARRQKIVWEVYAGKGRFTEECHRRGATVRRFGLADGWDFSKAKHRRALLELQAEDEPDEIFMSPKCTLWSTMQSINMKTEEDCVELQEKRWLDHEVHLKFCRKLYMSQVRGGRHAHIEHPSKSKAWQTPAFQNLPGMRVTFDQCAYGAVTWTDTGTWAPIRKTTSIQTTKQAMVWHMSRRCSQDHQHQPLEGGHRCKHAEDYPEILAQHLAEAAMTDEGLHEQAYAVGQEQQLTGVLRKLGTKHGSEAVRIAYRLHRNLGHPRPDILLELLKDKPVDTKVLDAIRDLECPYCNTFAVKKSSAPAHLDRAKEFNLHVQADVLWLDLDTLEDFQDKKKKNKKIGILVMVDEASRYMMARTIPDEQSQSLQKAFERSWVRLHGPPGKLFVDEHPAFGSDSTMRWAEEHGIELRISPGQSHTRTSLVERRHQLLRKSVQVFMKEHGLRDLAGLHDALNWVVPSLNDHTFVNGFTPTQLALGRQPNLPGLLSDEKTTVNQLQMGEQERLHRRLQLKFSAQAACAKAEVDVKLRRALLRKFTGKDEELHPGERCLYWREAPDKQHIIQWSGPAIVLAVERNPDSGTVAVYWLAHGTSLLRAGRQHVRKMPREEGMLDGEKRVHQSLAELRQRRVVRILDLNKLNRRSLNEIDPENTDDEELLDPILRQQHEEPPEPHAASGAPGGGILALPPPPDETNRQQPQPAANEVGDDTVQADGQADSDDQLARERAVHNEALMRQFPTSAAARPTPSPIETDVMMNPEALPPVPDDDDLMSPTVPAASVAPTEPEPDLEIDPIFKTPVGTETFEQKRARLNKQETLWMRRPPSTSQARGSNEPSDEPRIPHEPPTPGEGDTQHLDKRQRTDDFLEEAFHVELTSTTEDKKCVESLNDLAEGWTYDSKTQEFTLGPTTDFWNYEDGFLVRHHCWAREQTFHLSEASLPEGIHMSELQTSQGLTMIQGQRKIYVNQNEPYIVGKTPWFGKTLFPLTRQAVEKRRMPFAGDLAEKTKGKWSIRGRGHIWTAVGVSKTRRAKDDLRESKMTLEDRLAFIHGKKAELSSIFENGAWEIETSPENIDHSRVMKARFVLKWVTDNAGNPKAKARLVLQGFADPDLLQGAWETSSPTLSRTSRQTLLAIACNEHWSKFTADVSTAFLQGDKQARLLWCRIPADACKLMGCPAGTHMKLLKPLYGQADAPRAWFQVAKRRLCSVGYTVHALDHCLFRLHNQSGRLVSLIGLHVDDMIGAGDETDEVYLKARESLKKEFNFKHWTTEEKGELEFCGNKLTACENGAWKLQQEEYMKKIKPMTTTAKKQDDELRPGEVSSLRGLLGALQWASTQTSPHMSASISILCGNVSGATQSVAEAANKTLRFGKSNADIGLTFQRLGPLEDLRLLSISDAAWGVRSDHLSQGGYFVLLTHKKALEGEPDQPYVIIDWRSFKLPRVSRSSLNAEAQSCSAAVDSLEFVHIFWQACHQENFKLEQVKDNQRDRDHFLPSALIIDAKVLHDAIKAEVPQINGDKRTQTECMIVKQKMQNLKTQLRWVSSEVQLSDGLTKIQARQLLADRLRTHRISLMADSTFQAAKRKTMQERRDNARRNAISVKKSLTMMIIANELTPTRAQGEDDETGWDLTLLVIGTLLCIGAFQVVGWLIACWRQRAQRNNPTVEAQSQTDQDEQQQQPAPQRRETSDRLEARITQYKDFIRRGNETMDRVRKENERLEDQCKELEARCRELEIEIQARDVRQNLTDERLDEQQRMITQLERDLANIAQQAAYLNNHLGGIPQTVYITRHGRKFHIDPQCSALTQTTEFRDYDYCSMCVNRVTPAHRRPHGSSGGT